MRLRPAQRLRLKASSTIIYSDGLLILFLVQKSQKPTKTNKNRWLQRLRHLFKSGNLQKFWLWPNQIPIAAKIRNISVQIVGTTTTQCEVQHGHPNTGQQNMNSFHFKLILHIAKIVRIFKWSFLSPLRSNTCQSADKNVTSVSVWWTRG